MAEIILTDENFDQEVLKSDKPVLVDFWAPWCGPCQMTGPAVEQIAHEYETKGLKVGKLNVDDNPTTSGNYQVMSIPTFLVFKGGQVVDQLVGGVPKEKLQELVDRHL